jgi:hypothetical protein
MHMMLLDLILTLSKVGMYGYFHFGPLTFSETCAKQGEYSELDPVQTTIEIRVGVNEVTLDGRAANLVLGTRD